MTDDELTRVILGTDPAESPFVLLRMINARGAEIVRLRKELRDARNEIARLNGQTFEVVDLDDVRAEAWDRGKAAGFTQLTAGAGTITPADVANPYRKDGE